MRYSSPSKAVAISTVLFGAGFVSAQATTGCVSLKGSAQCPSFQDAYVNPTNLTGSWPWFSLVSDVASFDKQFAQYFTDPNRFIATKFESELQCNESAIYNTTLQWERTILCGQFSQISYSAQCNLQHSANPIMVCQDTCLQYSASEHDAVDNAAVCAPESDISAALFNIRNATLLKDYVTCTNWTSLVSTTNGTCVEGVTNEGNCGYGPGVSTQLCAACDPTGNVTVSSCCYDQKTDLSQCANYGHPGAAAVRATGSAAPGFVSATGSSSTSAASPTGGTSADSNASNTVGSTGLTGGQLAGIIVGSVIGALILGALLALLLFGLCKKKNRQDPESSRGLVYAGRSSTGEKPWNQSETGTQRSIGESPLDGEKNLSPGSSGHAKLAGAGAAGVGAGALGGAALLASAESSPQARPDSQLSSGTGGSDGRGTTIPSAKDTYTGQTIFPGEEVIAIFPYTQSLNDELTLEVDQKVTVLRLFDDSWAACRNSSGREGMIPLVCISSMKGDVPGRRAAGTGTTSEDGSGDYTSSVENAVTADEAGFTSDVSGYRSARSR